MYMCAYKNGRFMESYLREFNRSLKYFIKTSEYFGVVP